MVSTTEVPQDEAKLVVKHTFLEFSAPRESSRRLRAQTDSAIARSEKEVGLCSVDDGSADAAGELSCYNLPINCYNGYGVGGAAPYGMQEHDALWWGQYAEQASMWNNGQALQNFSAGEADSQQWGWWGAGGYEQDSPCTTASGSNEQAARACGSPAKVEFSGSSSNSTPDLDQDEAGTRTTVMLRNMPNDYTRSMLIELIDGEGFAGSYDFVYLPVDFNTMSGLGYAFVNLTTPVEAGRFWQHFEAFARWAIPSEKVCTLNWSSPHQGLESHIERYRNSPVMHEAVPDNCKPMLIINGVRIAFPPATKKVKAPRIRCRP